MLQVNVVIEPHCDKTLPFYGVSYQARLKTSRQAIQTSLSLEIYNIETRDIL